VGQITVQFCHGYHHFGGPSYFHFSGSDSTIRLADAGNILTLVTLY
jgi:hypothetical protein